MKQEPHFKILPDPADTKPRGLCSHRGDLGCLAEHAKAAGYRAQGLANSLGVMPRELRRDFKETFGISLKNWLIRVRSEQVTRRLRGNESFEKIVLSVGFSHSKELARDFRKVNRLSESNQ